MRSVILYGALLGAALVGSYLTWTSEGPGSTDDERKVELYAATEGEVTSLSYTGPLTTVSLERREDAKGSYPWLVVDERREIRVQPIKRTPEPLGPDDTDADTDTDTDTDEPEEKVRIEEIHREFRGNDAATEVFAAFEPLVALRELDASVVDREAFGLAEPEQTVRIKRTGGDLSLSVGNLTYGTKDYYAELNGRVLLVDDTAIKPLRFAGSRLLERRLHPFTEADIVSIDVEREEAELTLTQQNASDLKARFWSRGAETDADDAAGSWVGKLLRLRAEKHAGDGLPEGAEPLMSVDLVGADERWTIDLFEHPTQGMFATSDWLRDTIHLPAATASEVKAEGAELFQE